MIDPRDYAHEHAHGGMSRQAYADDPKRLCFTLARYKHVAKMLEGIGRVLEVGCADGFGSRIVRQHVGALTAIDADAQSIKEARQAPDSKWDIEFMCLNFIEVPPVTGKFDAVYALDVMEHIKPDHAFLRAMHAAAPVAIIGMPSLESQDYASEMSRLGHVNCYSGVDFKKRLQEFWDHVFLFTMHDETLGTGFLPMAHYLLALCVRS